MSISTSVASPTLSADQHLAEQVAGLLEARHGRFGKGLHIKVQEGIATLRGRAKSYYQKQIWLHEAKKTTGVQAIIDQIEVATYQ